MKRISVIAFIALLLAVSCDGSAPAPDTESGRLLLETNVRSIQKDSSTAAEARTVYETGEPIIGVLLQTNTGSKDTFRLEYKNGYRGSCWSGKEKRMLMSALTEDKP